MILIKTVTRIDILHLGSIFFLGILLGACVIFLGAASSLDKLALENAELKADLEDKAIRLEKLEESLIASVRNTEVKVAYTDPHIRVELEKQARNLVSNLIGQQLTDLHPSIIRNILHDRPVILNSISYHFEVESILISQPHGRVEIHLKAVRGEAVDLDV